MESLAVIVVTCIRNEFQKDMLIRSIDSIQKAYPNADTVLIDDSGKGYSLDISNLSVSVYTEAKAPKCGEINAYIWACENHDKYSHFLFVHDSTVCISPISLSLCAHPLTPLWFASKQAVLADNCFGKENDAILDMFEIDSKEHFLKTMEIVRARKGEVIFGGMALFTPEFCEFLKDKTNFLSIAHMFNTRHLRSFFERFLYCVANEMKPYEKFREIAICKDIFRHSVAFFNKSYDIKLAGNPYVLKLWQGR
jgi:hypothetical protein